MPNLSPQKTAIFAGGCFWCMEAVFQLLKGVNEVRSGFTGGHIRNPPYREVCTGRTGHAEAVRIEFQPELIPYRVLLEVFFSIHDPTTLNRQGNDKGTQYRSAIFWTEASQKAESEQYLELLRTESRFTDPIVTELVEATEFFNAEPEHKDYYRRHGDQPYCQVIISPKVMRVREQFRPWLKI